MNVYFDSNVYDAIWRGGSIAAARQFLDGFGCEVEASSENLFEVLAIGDASLRRARLAAINAIASRFEEVPMSFRHAVELRREIGRLRPNWLKRPAFERGLKSILADRRRLWVEASKMDLTRGELFAQYREISDEGITSRQSTQRELRRAALQRTAVKLGQRKGSAAPETYDVDLRDPEQFWRVESLLAWHEAMVLRRPTAGDYFDWLDPYLKRDVFGGRDYASFWLDEVAGENVPANRLSGLVAFYQLDRKVTRGNAVDQLHASALLKADLFVTADQPFFLVLEQILRAHPIATRCRLVLADNAALISAPIDELKRCFVTK